MSSTFGNTLLRVRDVSANTLSFNSSKVYDKILTEADISDAVRALTIQYKIGSATSWTSITYDDTYGWKLPSYSGVPEMGTDFLLQQYNNGTNGWENLPGDWTNGYYLNVYQDDDDDYRPEAVKWNTSSGTMEVRQSAYWTGTHYTKEILFQCMMGNSSQSTDIAMYGFSIHRNIAEPWVPMTTTYNDYLVIIITQAGSSVGSTVTYSDKRIKKNFVPIENAMKSIDKINIVKYDKYVSFDKKGTPYKEIGVIAQEIKMLNDPILMKSLYLVHDEGSDKYFIDYNILFCLAIKAFQELHDEYEKFKEEKNKKLLHLMERITALENKKKMKNEIS